jgi:hypothetical protein
VQAPPRWWRMTLSIECPSKSLYRVEVSGWDENQCFFVEKSELEWKEESGKQVALSHAILDGAVIFLRLMQPISTSMTRAPGSSSFTCGSFLFFADTTTEAAGSRGGGRRGTRSFGIGRVRDSSCSLQRSASGKTRVAIIHLFEHAAPEDCCALSGAGPDRRTAPSEGQPATILAMC